MQDDESAMLRGQADERALDEVTIRQVKTGIASRRFVDGSNLDLGWATPTSAGLVEACIHEKAVEPGVEPVRITKSGQVPPGSHQGVLDRVARELRVPEDEARGRVQAS